MAALPSAPFVALFASSWFVLCQGTQELKETVKAGEDATLQCRGHRGADITLIKWSRTDLTSVDGYVFLFRDGFQNEIDQHESFRGRVHLTDPEMKDGDASVILKNVETNDNGTYKCSIIEGNLRRRKRDASQLISTIRLTVTEPGHTAGHVGLIVSLTGFAVLLVAVAGTIVKKRAEETQLTQENRQNP